MASLDRFFLDLYYFFDFEVDFDDFYVQFAQFLRLILDHFVGDVSQDFAAEGGLGAPRILGDLGVGGDMGFLAVGGGEVLGDCFGKIWDLEVGGFLPLVVSGLEFGVEFRGVQGLLKRILQHFLGSFGAEGTI